MPANDVRVVPDCRWDRVQVGGREFTRFEAVRLGEAELTDEIRNSPLLLVEQVGEPVPPADQPARSAESTPEPAEPKRKRPSREKGV